MPPNGDSAELMFPLKKISTADVFYQGQLELTGIQPNHASFEIFKKAPDAIDVFGKAIRCEAHLPEALSLTPRSSPQPTSHFYEQHRLGE